MNSEVWSNFINIQQKNGVIKKASKETKAEDNKLYNLNSENAGDDTINEAHPDGGPVVAQSDSDGGKVETQVEQQAVNEEAATNIPTGNIVAETVLQLTKIAEELEEQGNLEAANLVDNTATELAGMIDGIDLSDIGQNPVAPSVEAPAAEAVQSQG